MNKKVEKILANKNDSIKEVMKKIDHAGTKICLIVDKDRKLIGIVSDGDIRRAILKGKEIDSKVEEIMSYPQYAVKDLSDINYSLLADKGIDRIPLIDENKKVIDLLALSPTEKKFVGSSQNSILDKPVKKILVIGGGGYVGSVLTRNLLAKGYYVNVLDRFLYGREPLKEVEKNPKLQIFEGDTRHIEEIVNSMEGCDAVVHLAEIVGDPACELNPQLTQENNYLATKIIAESCKMLQINRFIYSSSCSVYGASEDSEILGEESSLNPVSLYAKMKIASENALKEISDDNFKPTIVRFGTLFGKSHRPRFDLVVNFLTAKAMKDKEITIFNGDQWRPLVHVSDASDSVIKIIEAPLIKVQGEVFNVGSEKNNLTIDDIGKKIKKVVEDSEIVCIKNDSDRRDYKVSFKKLRRIIDNEKFKNVEEGIIEIKRFLEELGDINYLDRKYNNLENLKERVNLF